MKNKRFLKEGLIFILLGITCFVLAMTLETKLNSILFGLTGSFCGPGIYIVAKYFYWSSPKRKQLYEQKTENDYIELHDERKEMIRGKAARFSLLVNMLITSVSVFVVSILGQLEIISWHKPVTFFIAFLFIVQAVASQIIYKQLEKKS